MENLTATAYRLRGEILDMIYRAKTGHIGGDFSVCDILVALYYKHLNVSPATADETNRDRLILSKGHSVEALYCVLADRGFFPREDLLTYSQFGSNYIGHPNNKVRGIEMNSGSLGHGLSVGVGMALAGRMDGAPYRVVVVTGDGELAEGSVWEGAMAAGHYGLDNLTAIVDRNGLQISGPTEDVMRQDPQEDRWRSFGWNVLHARGNDIADLDRALAAAKAHTGAPTVILAHTTKGFGVSFMENEARWHHGIPTESEYERAKAELEERRRNAQ